MHVVEAIGPRTGCCADLGDLPPCLNRLPERFGMLEEHVHCCKSGCNVVRQLHVELHCQGCHGRRCNSALPPLHVEDGEQRRCNLAIHVVGALPPARLSQLRPAGEPGCGGSAPQAGSAAAAVPHR